ncbi:MAG TPA: HlyD family efflux transporter periplasmic adaptor subunit [Gemmataceae bacterium]|jgi:multidrug efflux pump subunit AcrA (membrane-fusion protein)|nr:HlyD family efflux transporter periplasmic adaptor subunit [Gemmataceae bacterium]
MVHVTRTLGCLAVLFVLAGCDLAPENGQVKKPDQQAKKKPAAPAAKPATHKVEKEPFKVELTLKGTFEAEDMTEVTLSPEAWTSDAHGALTVKTAVEHGTPVHKGDTLITLDLSKIDQAIKELESDNQLADLAIKQAEEELPVQEKSLPLDLADAERAKKVADEDLKHFTERDRAFQEKTVQFEVKSARDYLEYVKEELKQLEKMYRSKDMTEDTEEIILKRQRDQVERMAFMLQTAEVARDLMLKVTLPRRDQTLHENAVRTGLTLHKAKTTLPLGLSQKRLALTKLKYDREKSADKLHKLEKDHDTMTVKAPADGIVYYGKCARGQWSTAATVAAKLQRGGTLTPDEVILTIVKHRPLFVRAAVEEKELHHLQAGLPARVVPVPYPDLKLAAKIDSVSAIPGTSGAFEARVAVMLGKDAAAIMPGMACHVKLVAYKNPDALTVPAAAVFTEPLDDDSHYVYVWGKDGKPEKRPVVVGQKAGDTVEVRKGLHEGDEVLLEKPGAAKAAHPPEEG